MAWLPASVSGCLPFITVRQVGVGPSPPSRPTNMRHRHDPPPLLSFRGGWEGGVQASECEQHGGAGVQRSVCRALTQPTP